MRFGKDTNFISSKEYLQIAPVLYDASLAILQFLSVQMYDLFFQLVYN